MLPVDYVLAIFCLLLTIVLVVLDRRNQQLQAGRAEEIRALTEATMELTRAIDRVERREREG